MRRKAVLPERELYSKTASIIENLKNVKIDIYYSRGHNYVTYYGNNGGKFTYVINLASPKIPHIEKYTALSHELAHIMCDSPITELKQIFENDLQRLPSEYRGSGREIYLSAFNIIEDQRIESLWGKIYLGTNKRFKKTREDLGKDLKQIVHPIDALLASRFGRKDLIPKEYKVAERIIDDVECTEREASIILTKQYIKEVLEPYILSLLPDEAPKSKANCDIDGKSLDGDSVESEKGSGTSESKSDMPKLSQKDNEKLTKLDRIANDSYTMNALADHKNFEELSTNKLNTSVIEKGTSQISGLKKKGQEKIEQMRKELQNNITGERKVLPSSLVKVDFLERDAGQDGEVNSKVARKLNRVFKLLQSKKKTKFDTEGDEMSILQVIKRKTLGYGEVFHKKIDTNDLAVCISIDASGSMEGDYIKIARDMVATLYSSLENIKGINLNTVMWSSNHVGDLGLTEINSLKETRNITVDRGYCLTPTHLAVTYSAKKLRSMKGKTKLLIVLTDGSPNYEKSGSNITSASVMESTKRAIKSAKSEGIKVLGILVSGDYMDYVMKEMFGKDFIICNDMNKASDKLIYNIKQVVVKQMRRN